MLLPIELMLNDGVDYLYAAIIFGSIHIHCTASHWVAPRIFSVTLKFFTNDAKIRYDKNSNINMRFFVVQFFL